MRQFDVCPNPSPRSAKRAPFLVVMPDNRFSDHTVTLVVPLVANLPEPVPRLNIEFVIDGRPLFFSPLEMANIRSGELRAPVANLAGQRDQIVRAIDVLFTGV